MSVPETFRLHQRPRRRTLAIRGAALGTKTAVLIGLMACAGAPVGAAEPSRFTVEDTAIAPEAPAISATIGAFGEGSRLSQGGDFEPLVYRKWYVVADDAPADAPGEARIDAASLSGWGTLRDGALDGAEISVLRVVDGALREVRQGRVAAGGFDLSGWFSQTKSGQAVSPRARGLSIRLAKWERPGVPRWYTLRAFDDQGRLSDHAPPVRVVLPDAIGGGTADEPRQDRALVGGGPKDALIPADPDAPAPPRNLTAAVDATGRVSLSWQAPPEDRDVAGYVVLQSSVDPAEMEGFRLQTESEGEPIRAGDLVVLRAEIDTPLRDRFLSDRVWSAAEMNFFRPRMMSDWPDEIEGATWSIRRHPAAPDRDWGGRSYLEVQLAPGETKAVGTYNHSGTEQDFYEVLRPDVDYRVSVRLRGQVPGRAMLRFSGPLKGKIKPLAFDYGTEWQEVTGRFRVPDLVKAAKPIGRIDLVLQGPGTIDVDDIRIHRADTAFLDYSVEDYARLEKAQLSALRTHGLIKTGEATYDLAHLVGAGGLGLRGTRVPGLPETLAMMDRAKVAPWLQIEPHLSDGEWKGLVEYLAAPFDPETDDAARYPWAALRVAQGRAAPWTDAFDRIYLELGNETWNRLFAPWVFPGLPDQATGRQLSPAEVYGVFQSHVARTLRDSPWWDAAGLEGKVSFVIGGRSGFDYGEIAAAAAPDAADLLAHAAYNGGWDEGEGPPRPSPQSFSSVLNQVSQVSIPRARAVAQAARDLEQDRDRPLATGTYEAGPGYAMNGLNNAKVSDEQKLAQERVMKSTAAGVATLDTFLAQRVHGFGMQNFFTFGEGPLWKSHAPWHKGGAPYPSWSLVTLLNDEASGEMLSVRTDAVEGRDLPGFKRRKAVDDAPQVAVYATRRDDRLTVIAISRRVKGLDGQDDDGCGPVEIALPVRQADAIRLVRTGGAPEDNGVDGPAPVIERVALDPSVIAGGTISIGPDTGGSPCGLAPASAMVFVIEGARP